MRLELGDTPAPRTVRLVTDGLHWSVEVLAERRTGFFRRRVCKEWLPIHLDGLSRITVDEQLARRKYARQIALERAAARGYTTVALEDHYPLVDDAVPVARRRLHTARAK